MNNKEEYLLSNFEIDDNQGMNFDQMRPTLIVEKKKQIFKKIFLSKWANLKLFLQEQKSLESSVQLQKQKTIEQFASKCKEIYTKKIEIQLITKKNRQMFKSYNSNDNEYTEDEDIKKMDEIISNFNIIDISNKPDHNSIKEFLFCFRKNNGLMLRLIECADNKQCEILVPFLCHFFYENFYMESTEQEEILYIIYLLLEKEIDSLYTPSVSTFLDQSFVSKFLTELGNRYEIKHYIDIILNYLILNIEEINITYNSLDILGNKSEEGNEYFDMAEIVYPESPLNKSNYYEENSMNFIINNSVRKTTVNMMPVNGKMNIQSDLPVKNERHVTSGIFQRDFNNGFNNFIPVNREELIKGKTNNYIVVGDSNTLKKELNPDLFNNINEKFIRDKIEAEKDDIMRHFYVRQLRKLQASRKPDLFNGSLYFEKMKYRKKISKFAVTQFNKGYSMVKDFIDELLTNLENEAIIPYSIKVICKFIYILLKKRFKYITEIQCHILICQFLFDKLIFPVLQNPDINDAGKDMIISFNTRKSLSNIYIVFKKLVRGELFSIEDKDYLVIFNKFIIENYHRINKIISKIIHVSAPKKLIELSNTFYKDDNFNLDDLKRDESSINYDYFQENPNDFMQHKSICFSIEELLLFFDIVNNNKERFIQENSTLLAIFKDLQESINNIRQNKNNYNYYLIISDEYDEEINSLLFHKDIKMALKKTDNNEEIIKNIQYCIGHLISNLEIYHNWKWVYEGWDTIRTFQFIYKYLTTYKNDLNCSIKDKKNAKAKDKSKAPLLWYSIYIINHIKKIKNEWHLKDYEKLYESLEMEINSQLKKLRRLNDFLTVNMSTKFILIDHKIKIFNQELENVKKTELNIKTVQFIEKTKIKVCLTTVDEIADLSRYSPVSLDYLNRDSPNKLILSTIEKKMPCIHKFKLEPKIYNKLKEKNFFKKNHCKNLNQFCLQLADYYNYICQDIIGIPKEAGEKYVSKSPKKAKIAKRRQTTRDAFSLIKESSSKEIVERYMKFLSNAMQDSPIFNRKSAHNLNKLESDKENVMHIIWNYILKTLCIRICENELNENDKNFRKVCNKLSWIKPENLEIPSEVFDKKLFKKAEYHIKKMDLLRTPGGMLHQFGLGVQLINSMFVFMLNQKTAEAGDLLPMIIYGIIKAKPKRMIFNIKFIKYFMNHNQLLGNIGYNLIQAESSMNYIQTINGEKLKMKEEEFEENCKIAMEKLEKNKNNHNVQSINDCDYCDYSF